MGKASIARKLLLFALCLGAFVLGRAWQSAPAVEARSDDRVFEIRMYTVEDGKVDLLSRVFRDNVTEMFARHGMTNVAYFIPQEEPQCGSFRPTATIRSPAFDYGACEWSRDTLIYILGHASREAAEEELGLVPAGYGWDAELPGGLRARRRQGAEDRVGVHGRHRVFRAPLASAPGRAASARRSG